MNSSKLKLFIEKRGIFIYYSLFIFVSISSFLGIRWAKYKSSPNEYSETVERKIPEDQLASRVKNPKSNRDYFETVEIFYVTEAVSFPHIKTREKEQIVKGGKSKPKED